MHPYTKALFSSVPVPDPELSRNRMVIKGEIPSAITPPPGCRFNPRCPFVFDRCRVEEPALVERGMGTSSLATFTTSSQAGGLALSKTSPAATSPRLATNLFLCF